MSEKAPLTLIPLGGEGVVCEGDVCEIPAAETD